MKKLFLLLTLSLFILSCDKAKEEKTQEKEQKTQEKKEKPQEKKGSVKVFVYSENIQDTFFGVKFGASREEVIKAFEKEGLYLNNHISDKDYLIFLPSGRGIRFGGFIWGCVQAYLSNGKFYSILFQYTPEDKETALSRFESVFSALSSRYKMNEMPFEDTNIYKKYAAFSEDGKLVIVKCHKAESALGEMRYYVNLEYEDTTLNKPSDEL